MTKLAYPKRIKVASLCVRLQRTRILSCTIFLPALQIATTYLTRLVETRNQRIFEEVKNAAANWQERVATIMPELKILNTLPEHRKSQVLAARSSLLEEYDRFKMLPSKFASQRVPASAMILRPLLTYLQSKIATIQTKTASLKRIIEGIDGNTFYSDLLLWLVTPSGYDEALVGDLKEERVFRSSADGEKSANAWYRHQIKTTLKDLLWTKIQRLAAIGTLIDLIDRWFRK